MAIAQLDLAQLKKVVTHFMFTRFKLYFDTLWQHAHLVYIFIQLYYYISLPYRPCL